jgi:hypothetical protein
MYGKPAITCFKYQVVMYGLTLSLTAGGPIGQHFFECKML